MNSLFNSLLQDIENYYVVSLGREPEVSAPLLVAFINKAAQLYALLPPDGQIQLAGMLQRLLQAMEAKDYVLVRDILFYEIKLLVGSAAI